MADASALQRVIQDLNALYQELPEGEGHANQRVQARYNDLVDRAQAVTGADLREFRVDAELVLSLGEFSGIDQDPGSSEEFLDLRSFRPLIAGLIGELIAYDPMPRSEPH
jgi:hypothetical protein